MRLKYVEVGGKRYLWAELLKLRREQQKAARQPQQETLFDLRDDRRPSTQTNASDRYANPLLFDD
jgi:hypothetical protein